VTILETLGGLAGYANDINDQGLIVGTAKIKEGNKRHAYLLKDGKMIDLGILGGTTSSGTAINEKGQVVGYSRVETGERHAFLWENGKMKDLHPPEQEISYAEDINDLGQVVGYTQKLSTTRGFIWENGMLTYLVNDNESWLLKKAVAINNKGQIVGIGEYRDKRGAFLLTPKESRD